MDIQYLYAKSIDIQNQMDDYVQWLRSSFLSRKGAILKEFQDVQITESVANIGPKEDAPKKLAIDHINDKQVEDKLREMRQFFAAFDTDVSIWSFKR